MKKQFKKLDPAVISKTYCTEQKEKKMNLIDKRGNKVHLPDETVPEEMKEWLYSSVQMVPDDTKLEKCWIASLFAITTLGHDEYEYVADEKYDHYPTEEELIWLMAKHNKLRFSYVIVDEGYQLAEEYD